MKKIRVFGVLVMTTLFVMLAYGCATGGGSGGTSDSVTAGPNETLVTIERRTGLAGSAARLTILIDGQEVMQLANNTVRTIVVPNGTRTIAGTYGNLGTHMRTKEPIQFQADSTPLSFSVVHRPDPARGGGDVLFELK